MPEFFQVRIRCPCRKLADLPGIGLGQQPFSVSRKKGQRFPLALIVRKGPFLHPILAPESRAWSRAYHILADEGARLMRLKNCD